MIRSLYFRCDSLQHWWSQGGEVGRFVSVVTCRICAKLINELGVTPGGISSYFTGCIELKQLSPRVHLYSPLNQKWSLIEKAQMSTLNLKNLGPCSPTPYWGWAVVPLLWPQPNPRSETPAFHVVSSYFTAFSSAYLMAWADIQRLETFEVAKTSLVS